jgi:hypothetical protein
MSILVQNQPLDNHASMASNIAYVESWYQNNISNYSLNRKIYDERAENLRKNMKKINDFPKIFTSELCKVGVGGTYILKNIRDDPFAVFKPYDEEPGCPNNPKDILRHLKEGVKPGEGAIREYAAYLLDKDHFAKVPKTDIIEISMEAGEKIGSVQQYVENVGTMDDFGNGLFTVENIQRIAQLDVRVMNMDRNFGNLLVIENDEGKEMIPIDHNLILPETLNEARFEWAYWKQANLPIVESVAEYIMNIDIERDVMILESLNFSSKSVENYKIATIFLKIACSNNWSFKRIADFICKKDIEKTNLEKIVEKVRLVSPNEQSFYHQLIEELNVVSHY